MSLTMILFLAVLAMQFGPQLAGRHDLHKTFVWPVIFCCGALSVLGFVSGSMFMGVLWAFFTGYEIYINNQRGWL